MDSVSAAASVAELQQWVREHRVTWETASRREAVHGQDSLAELELTLVGHCPHSQVPVVFPDGGALVYERLRSIALHVLEPVPEARYSIDPFDAAVRLRAEEGFTPEVELTLVVEQRRALAPIESGLQQLGVQRMRWREP
jgi:hypothetical protein